MAIVTVMSVLKESTVMVMRVQEFAGKAVGVLMIALVTADTELMLNCALSPSRNQPPGRRSPALQQSPVVVVRWKMLVQPVTVEEGLRSKLTEYLAGSSAMVPTKLPLESVKAVGESNKGRVGRAVGLGV